MGILKFLAQVFLGQAAPQVAGGAIKGVALATVIMPLALWLVEHKDENFTCITWGQFALACVIVGAFLLWAYFTHSPRQDGAP